jgi:hypothetical protein
VHLIQGCVKNKSPRQLLPLAACRRAPVNIGVAKLSDLPRSISADLFFFVPVAYRTGDVRQIKGCKQSPSSVMNFVLRVHRHLTHPSTQLLLSSLRLYNLAPLISQQDYRYQQDIITHCSSTLSGSQRLPVLTTHYDLSRTFTRTTCLTSWLLFTTFHYRDSLFHCDPVITWQT